jgi:flagellar hook-basal body complex protein FliE
MSISGIESVGFTPFVAPALPTSAPAALGGSESVVRSDAVAGLDFGSMLSSGVERLEGLLDRADSLAVQAATGDLSNLHDYTLAATEASVATQLTTAVRNKALEAFQEIMRMPI